MTTTPLAAERGKQATQDQLPKDNWICLTKAVLIPAFFACVCGQDLDHLPTARGDFGFWMVSVLMLIIVLSELWYLRHRRWIGRGKSPLQQVDS